MRFELTMREFKMFSEETQKNFLEHITSLPSNCRSFIRFNLHEIWESIFGNPRLYKSLALLDNRSDLAKYMSGYPSVRIIDNPSMSTVQKVHCETIKMIQELGPDYTGLQKELISLMYMESYDFQSYTNYERSCTVLLEKLCKDSSEGIPSDVMIHVIKTITSNITPLKILGVVFSQSVSRIILGVNDEYANLINKDDDRLLITYRSIMEIIYSEKPELSEVDLNRIADLMYIYGEMVGTIPAQFMYPIYYIYGSDVKEYIQQLYADKVNKSGSIYDFLGEIDLVLSESADPYDITGRQSEIFMRRVSVIDEEKYERVNVDAISKIIETMSKELIMSYNTAKSITMDFTDQEVMRLRNKYGLHLIIVMVHPIGKTPLHRRILLQVEDKIYALYKDNSVLISGENIYGISYDRTEGTARECIRISLSRDLFDFKY